MNKLPKETVERIEKDSIEHAHEFKKSNVSYRMGATQEALRAQVLVTEMTRMLDAHYHSLLEATAWMGIPEKKREDFIQNHTTNMKYIYENALKIYRGEK